MSDQDLGALADRAIEEYKLASGVGAEQLAHAQECGRLILEASLLMPSNVRFREWLESETEIAPRTAYTYMRLHHHRDKIPAGCSGITEARELLIGAERVETDKRGRVAQAIKDEVARLRDCGATWNELKEQFGRSTTALRGWVDPRVRKREAARRAKRKAEEQEKREALAEVRRLRCLVKAGGSFVLATKNLRSALKHVDTMLATATDDDIKQELRDVRMHWNRGLDALSRAALIQERR